MKGLDILRGLLSTPRPAPAPVPVDVATSAAIDVVRMLDLAVMHGAGDEECAAAAREAIARGDDIAWIGMAPSDVLVSDRGFNARARLRIAGETAQRTIMVKGDASGRITSVTSGWARP